MRRAWVLLAVVLVAMVVPASAENVIAYSQQLDNVAYNLSYVTVQVV